MEKLVSITFIIVSIMISSAYAQESEDLNGIQWMSFEEALEASEKEPKMWFIDMYTDWCGWCKRMDATTFKDSLIIEEINANYYAVKFDAEQKEDIVIGDSTYSFVPGGRNGYHELAAQLMNGRLSYPTYVFLTAEKQVLTAVPGYKVREDMLPILEFCSDYDPVNNPTDYKTFMLSYESPYGEAKVEGGE